MAEIDLEKMTDVDISALATRCLDCLDLSEKVQAVLRAFHNNDARAELATWLEGGEEDEDEE